MAEKTITGEEKKPKDGKVTAKKIFDDFKEAEVAHGEWNNRTMPDKAYEYFETCQTPSTADSGNSFWVQVNRVREAQKTRMGILTSSPPMWEVSGRGKDASDRDRIQNIRYMMIWMAKESGLEEELIRVLFNYSLIGMAWMRLRWDKAFITKMDTIGMTIPDSLDPRLCYPDPRARKSHVLDGRYCAYIHRVNKEMFREEFGERLMPDGEVKKLNVDKIFRDIEDSNHPDVKLNAGRADKDKEITVIEYDYYRIEKKKAPVGNEEVEIPMKEFRVALAAGYEVLADYPSTISDIGMWQKIVFNNDPMHDLPYSSSDFQAEKELQDLSNVMLSMAIDNMARQLNSPWLSYKGSRVNPTFWKNNASKSAVQLEWEYTMEMRQNNIPPQIAKPSREPPGQIGGDYLQTMMWVNDQFDRVSVKSVMKGENQSGVTSGKHAQLLVQQGLQPSYYTKQKLEGPLNRVGQVYYHHARTMLTDEMELPVDDEGIGVDKGIIINKTLRPQEVLAILEAGVEHGDEAVAKELKMVSVRKGEERLSLEEYMLGGGRLADFVKGTDATLVENDITFGNYNVGLTIDPSAEASKMERIERSKSLAGLMIQMGAPRTGLKYMLDTAEEPDREQLMEEIQNEVEENRQTAMMGQPTPEE